MGPASAVGGRYPADVHLRLWNTRLGAHVGRVLNPRLSLVGGVEFEGYGRPFDDMALCADDGAGGCLDLHPAFEGLALTIGARFALSSRLAVGVLAGGGPYNLGDAGDGTAGLVQADASLRLWRRLWLTTAARRVSVPSSDYRLTLTPVTLGIRIAAAPLRP